MYKKPEGVFQQNINPTYKTQQNNFNNPKGPRLIEVEAVEPKEDGTGHLLARDRADGQRLKVVISREGMEKGLQARIRKQNEASAKGEKFELPPFDGFMINKRFEDVFQSGHFDFILSNAKQVNFERKDGNSTATIECDWIRDISVLDPENPKVFNAVITAKPQAFNPWRATLPESVTAYKLSKRTDNPRFKNKLDSIVYPFHLDENNEFYPDWINLVEKVDDTYAKQIKSREIWDKYKAEKEKSTRPIPQPDVEFPIPLKIYCEAVKLEKTGELNENGEEKRQPVLCEIFEAFSAQPRKVNEENKVVEYEKPYDSAYLSAQLAEWYSYTVEQYSDEKEKFKIDADGNAESVPEDVFLQIVVGLDFAIVSKDSSKAEDFIVHPETILYPDPNKKLPLSNRMLTRMAYTKTKPAGDAEPNRYYLGGYTAICGIMEIKNNFADKSNTRIIKTNAPRRVTLPWSGMMGLTHFIPCNYKSEVYGDFTGMHIKVPDSLLTEEQIQSRENYANRQNEQNNYQEDHHDESTPFDDDNGGWDDAGI